MRMKSYRLFATILLLSIAYSCQKDNIVENEPALVLFTSDIQTKAFNSTWENGDQIGVFMKKTGEGLSTSSVINSAENIAYETSGNGAFVPESQPVYFPEDKSKVDFIVYYPYTSAISNYIYKVDVTDQSIPQKIDLLYSNNIVNINSDNFINRLQFTHQLSKISFNINASSNISSLAGLDVSIAGAKTKANFKLVDGSLTVDETSAGNIGFKTTITSNTAVAEAILIPDEGGANRIVTFNLPTVASFKWTIPTDVKLEKGKRYTFSITLNAEGIITNTGFIETPLMGDLPDNLKFITHMMPGDNTKRNYSMLYDTNNRLAYWVAYPLHNYYIGSSGRTDDWGYDPKFLQNVQPYLRNAFGISGIDRGHQIPSGDRTASEALNATTFYYTNMTAQSSTLNQRMWADLENKIRSWTQFCDTMYVVTGAMITTKTNTTIDYVTDNNGAQVAKPKYYFKALAQREGDTYYTIAFKMDNATYGTGESYNSYRLTVKQLEQETGFIFFPQIPEDTKNQIKTDEWY